MYKGRVKYSFFVSDLLLLMTLTRSYTAPVGTTSTNEKMVTSKGTFQEAVDTCAGWGGEWNLMGPRSVDEEKAVYKRLVSRMTEGQTDSVWTTLRHNNLRQWQNVDGTDYDGEIQLAGKQSNMCSLLKLRYEAVKAETCNSQGEGYICQIKDCNHCPYDISPRNCLKVDQKCYIFGCDVGGWYDAQNTCSRQGFSIISMETKSQLQQIVTWLNKRQHNTCTNFWVGLRKAAWYYNNTKASDEAGSTFWYKGEPKPESRCAVLQRFDDGYYWRSVNCEERHSFLCAQDNAGTSKTDPKGEHLQLNVTSANSNTCERLIDLSASTIIFCKIGLIFPILCFLMVLTIRCDSSFRPLGCIADLKRKRLYKETANTEEMHHLMAHTDGSFSKKNEAIRIHV